MKKILSVLMILVLLGGFVFAQEEGPVFEGEAKLSWGIDFGFGNNVNTTAKASHGFLNEASASVKLPLVKNGVKKGEGDVYAFIDLSGVSLGLAADLEGAKVEGKVGGVEAKICFYGAYITVYNAPDMTTSYAHRILMHDADDYPNKFENGFEGFGTKIGYANEDLMGLDVGLKFVSNGSWKDRDEKEKKSFDYKKVKYEDPTPITETHWKDNKGKEIAGVNGDILLKGSYYVRVVKVVVEKKDLSGKYGFGIDFHMVPVEKFLTVDVNFNVTFDDAKTYKKEVKSTYKKDKAMAIGFKLSSTPIEGLTLDLGFDGGSSYLDGTKGIFAWAFGFGAEYTAASIGTFNAALYVASKSTPYGEGWTDGKSKVNGTDMAMSVGYKGLPLVEGLDFHTKLNVYRLLSKLNDIQKKLGYTIPLDLNVGVGYTIKIGDEMSIKPYADLWGATNVAEYKGNTIPSNLKAYFGIAYALGVEFVPMANLTVDAKWSHGKQNSDYGTYGINPAGYFKGAIVPCQNKVDNGRFVLSAKITY